MVKTVETNERPRDVSSPRGAGRGAKRRQRSSAGKWLGPSIILIVTVIAYPIFEVVRTSFLKINPIGLSQGFAGLANYSALFAEPALVPVVIHTILWVVVVVGVTIFLSLVLAQFLNKRFLGRRFVRWALIVPWASSLVMTATVWRYIYERDFGVLNRVLFDLGLIDSPVDWFRQPALVLPCLMVIGIIASLPFTTYVLIAGLQTVPDDLLEAAMIDGAGPWQRYRHVTFPMLRFSLVVAFVLNTIYVFNSFPIIWIITGKLPGNDADTTITFMYKIAFTAKLDPGEAGALAVINVLLLMIPLIFYLRRIDFSEGATGADGMSAGTARTRLRSRWCDQLTELLIPFIRPVQRGLARAGEQLWRAWRPVRRGGLPLAGLIVAAFFLAPYAVMFLSALKSDQGLFHSPALYLPNNWHWNNFIEVWSKIPLAAYLKASIVITVASTALVLFVSVPAAYFVARHRFRGRKLFLYVVLVTQMLSPVALIIGIYREVVLADTYLGKVNQSLSALNTYWAIVIVNAAFNLAFSIWILNGYFSSIPKQIEESAMVDGLGRVRVLTRIVVPLAKPGIVTAVIFTYVQVWNEFVVARTIFNDPTSHRQTITVGINQLVGLYQTDYQYLFVASLIGIVPVVILFAAIERYLVGGLTAGAVK